jgi:hypothetical protein
LTIEFGNDSAVLRNVEASGREQCLSGVEHCIVSTRDGEVGVAILEAPARASNGASSFDDTRLGSRGHVISRPSRRALTMTER